MNEFYGNNIGLKMNKQQSHSIPAFTIFEVTIVLAVMSVIAAMVTFSVNSLFSQMHTSEAIHKELNNFYRVRSTLWYDCISADSVVYYQNTFVAYQSNRTVTYSLEDEQLVRQQNGMRELLGITVKSIKSEETKQGEEIILTFDWKEEELLWRYFNRPNLAAGINQFFDERDG